MGVAGCHHKKSGGGRQSKSIEVNAVDAKKSNKVLPRVRGGNGEVLGRVEACGGARIVTRF